MTIADIRESGLLELHVLNEASADDRRIVLAALEKYPELKRDIQEIEYSLFKYADLHAVQPSASAKVELLKKINNQNNNQISKTNVDQNKAVDNKRSFLTGLLILSLIGLGALATLFFSNKNKFDQATSDYERDKIACDSTQIENQQLSLLVENLSDPNSKILAGEATENYQGTIVYIHNNAVSAKNYMQIQNLPAIDPDQSYQLWSLKDGVDPIPMDVFQGDSKIFEIGYEGNTNAYAITIEARGGVQSPTLTRLIAVIATS